MARALLTMTRVTDQSPFQHRSEPRYRVSWRGRLQVGDAPPVDIRVKDISTRGVGVVVDQLFAVGTIAIVNLRVPDPTGANQALDVAGRARVAFCSVVGRDVRMGLIWLDPVAEVASVIDLWLRKLRAPI